MAGRARLFGRVGGIISLLLLVFTPLILSHGVIATSDAWGTLCFLAATGCIWLLLQRITWWRLILSCTVVGIFFITKLTAFYDYSGRDLAMAVIRVWNGVPLRVNLGPLWVVQRTHGNRRRFARGYWRRILLVAGVIIWSAFGFQFEAFNRGNRRSHQWQCKGRYPIRRKIYDPDLA